ARRRLGGAGLRQALYPLDLAGRPADGRRRPAGDVRSPLSHGAGSGRRRPRAGGGELMMKNLKLFIPLAIFLVLGVFLLRGLDRDPSELPSALIDRPVPAFTLPDLQDGTQTRDQSLFQGQVSLLNVWGTWCVACRVEHPFLVELAASGV